jgi:hypothetical protein
MSVRRCSTKRSRCRVNLVSLQQRESIRAD